MEVQKEGPQNFEAVPRPTKVPMNPLNSTNKADKSIENDPKDNWPRISLFFLRYLFCIVKSVKLKKS